MSPALALFAAALLGAGGPPPAAPPPPPPPSDAQCLALPAVKPPFAFSTGEELEYDLDALGAQAGKLFLRVLPLRDGMLPVQAEVKTGTFFAKIRRVTGGGTSFLSPKTLRPTRYSEDTHENEMHRRTEVTFRPGDHAMRVDFQENERPATHFELKTGSEGLDVVGAMYLLRQIPLKEGTPICFDAYGIRRVWRVFGKVEGKEHISLPLGEFDTWHLAGVAVRRDDLRARREVHIWVSADGRHLPLVAMGVIDLGAVRATLSAFSRPLEARSRAAGKETLKW